MAKAMYSEPDSRIFLEKLVEMWFLVSEQFWLRKNKIKYIYEDLRRQSFSATVYLTKLGCTCRKYQIS